MLSAQARAILQLIADGHSYSQILDHYPDLTYPDIFAAAQEALDLALDTPTTPEQTPQTKMERIKAQFPRAYSPWTLEEDESLQTAFHALRQQAYTIPQISKTLSQQFERQPSAIESRLRKVQLIG
ncbi:MAG: DUF433 domain-containing protein [Chloroflexi bacterium]|nr:DUF433 domain-containing protein [Chloroflexota bacterium]